MLRAGFEDACYERMSPVKSGEHDQWLQLKRMLIKGSVPTLNTIVQHSLRLIFRQSRVVSSLFLFISRAWDVLILLVFPRDYICAFLMEWKSYQLWFPSYLNNRNTLFVMKLKPSPELSYIPLREQCETSGGYDTGIHKFEGAVYSSNLSFRKSILRAINFPLPSRN